MEEKRYLTKNCMNCANIIIISEGWGKQQVRDCKGRRIIPNHCCGVFKLNKQAEYWLKYNKDYELVSVEESV